MHLFQILSLVVVSSACFQHAGVYASSSGVQQEAATKTTKATTSQWTKIRHAVGAFSDVFWGHHSVPFSGKQQGLTVIGAGFPRTGTKSIEAALVSLGHRIYDPRSVMENKHETRWIAAARGWKIHNDLTELERLVTDLEAAGYTATLDMPPFLFAEPLAKLRPNAKVLLSVRDNVEQWIRSFSFINEIFSPFLYCRPWIWFMPDLKFNVPILELVLGISSLDIQDNPEYVKSVFPWYDYQHTNPLETVHREHWMNAYDAHAKRVIEGVPEERLLVFNVKQGWEPLITFFELDTNDPEIAAIVADGFPHVNERATLEAVRKAMTVVAFGFPLWVILPVVIVSLCLRLVLQKVKGLIGKPTNSDKSKSD